jgi:hypothetical protein
VKDGKIIESACFGGCLQESASPAYTARRISSRTCRIINLLQTGNPRKLLQFVANNGIVGKVR